MVRLQRALWRYEVMRMTERLQNLVTEGTHERIKEVAVEDGMKTLLVYSLEQNTQLEEVGTRDVH